MPNEERKQKSEKILKEKGYEILEFLGQGAYSTVFKCKNKENRLVAAKVAIGTKSDITNEISSANELNSLKQHGWDKYKGAIEKANKHYYKYINKPIFKEKLEISDSELIAIFESPLIDNDLWKSIVMSKTPINYDELRKVSKNVLKALQVIHSQGKVHSDIKPDNIYRIKLQSGKENFQLGDFGKMRDVKGEQDTKTDIFALGKTLISLYIAEIQNQLYIFKFPNQDILKVEELIRDLHSNKYKSISDNPREELFLDFVKKLIIKDRNSRPNATEALNHPFLKKQ